MYADDPALESNNPVNPSPILSFGNGWVAVNKRAGEICEEASKEGQVSVLDRIRPDLERLTRGKVGFLSAVHRLDQPVTGVVLIAYDEVACSGLSGQFQSGSVRKLYWAIVESPRVPISGESGEVETYIRFDPSSARSRILPLTETPRGAGWKKARLRWRICGHGERYLFLEAEPLTGRTHQIRAQLASLGMPIKGDVKYGARRSERMGGIRLHAARVSFHDPRTGEYRTVDAPIDVPDPLWLAFPGVESHG